MKRKYKGMFTVEMTLVFPVVFLSIMFLIYVGILKFQNVVNATAVTQAANKIATYYKYLGENDNLTSITEKNSAKNFLTRDMFKNRGLYRSLVDFDQENKKVQSKKYAKNLLDEEQKLRYLTNINQLKKYNTENINIKKDSNMFLFQYIEVSTKKLHPIPILSGFSDFTQYKQDFDNNQIKARASLIDAPEFVRNIDFVKEIIEGSIDTKKSMSE